VNLFGVNVFAAILDYIFETAISETPAPIEDVYIHIMLLHYDHIN